LALSKGLIQKEKKFDYKNKKKSSNCKGEYSEIGHSHILIYFNIIVVIIIVIVTVIVNL